MLKKLLILLSITTIAACGGGGDDAAAENVATDGTSPVIPVEEEYTEEYIAREWNLPDEPDEEANNATVKGIDVLKNNVRDDWERDNAIASFPDKLEFKMLNRAAQINNEMIDAYNAGNNHEILKLWDDESLLLMCYKVYFGYKNSTLLYKPSYDTDKREDVIDAIESLVNDSKGGFDELPTYDILEKECPKLKDSLK